MDNCISKNQAFRNQMNTFLLCQEMGNFEDRERHFSGNCAFQAQPLQVKSKQILKKCKNN